MNSLNERQQDLRKTASPSPTEVSLEETSETPVISPSYPPKGNMFESDKKAESFIAEYRPAL